MADQQVSKGCERATGNGETHFHERSKVSLNGKRPLDSEMAKEHENNDLSSCKRSKTLPVSNGVDYSSTTQPSKSLQSNVASTIHNGFVEASKISEEGAMSKTATLEDVSEMHNRNNGTTETSLISQSAKHTHPRIVDSKSDLKTITPDTPPSQQLAAAQKQTRPIKELKDDSHSGAEPEIITLSDSEDEFQEVLSQALSHSSSNVKRCQLLKLYQDHLRAEETKLILLKKLKLSLTNTDKHSTSATIGSGNKVSDVRSSNMTSQRGSGNAPPPLKRGQQPQQGLSNTHPSHHKATHHHHPTPTATDRSKAVNSNGPNSAGPPPLVNMAKSSSHGSGSSSGSYNNYQSSAVTQPKKAAPPAPPKLTPEQTLAAAKMALRKQLEQALQQIPAPKPPPPEVNFLPSLASGEFIYLIGMEEVVKQLLSTDQKDVKFVFNPFSCVQCDTDFTPVWKRDKPGSKNVICERCITSNQKQVLKQEHTAKLKSVFSKALQKEQEIERRVTAGSPLSDMPGLAASVVRHQQTAASAPTPSMPQLTAQHTQSSPSPNSQQLSASQLHQQAMLQAQADQMRAMIAAQMLPYQLYSGVGVTNKQAADLHRQYLLDMINQNRSSSWKT